MERTVKGAEMTQDEPATPPATAPAAAWYSEEREQVAAWSAHLPDRYLLCRDLGHNWRPWRARLTDERGFEQVLRCARCRAERSRTVGASGATLGNHYHYPDGYTAPAGTGRLTGDSRNALRLESVLRLIAHQGDDDD
jgi:hypothetical protein